MHRIILIVLLLFTTSSFAAELTDVYRSQANLGNQQQSEHQRVLLDVLCQILLKSEGGHDALYAADEIHYRLLS